MIDTHAHLDACRDEPAALIERAREAGVDRIVSVGSGLDSCRRTLAVAQAHDGVFAALGIHPHQAADGAGELAEVQRLAAEECVVAVGETGLDFYRDYAPRPAQQRLFHHHLELARELGKAVVVHSRGADAETAAALEGFDGPVVLHCFSSPGLLEVALDRRYFVSFAGNVTYPNARDLRIAVNQVHADRLLAETDSPYLGPQPVRGRPNEPAHVIHTVAAIAEVRGVDPAELGRQFDANASIAFSLP